LKRKHERFERRARKQARFEKRENRNSIGDKRELGDVALSREDVAKKWKDLKCSK
jgi:hypothetical protein